MAKRNAPAETFDLVVTQSNKLIEAAYPAKLTARAHKTARFIVALIKPDDVDLKLYTVKIDYLKRFLGYQDHVTWGNFADEMNDIFNRLTKETIYIKDGDEAISAKFLASVKTNLREQTVTFEISVQLKPYLLELKKNFTTYQLRNIPKLKSVYSIRLYELLTQFRKIGWRTFRLEELQKKIGSDYTLYGDFKRKALSIAQRDLETLTDIRFEYDEIKEGKRVAAIKFYIYPNRPADGETPTSPLLADLFSNVEVRDRLMAAAPDSTATTVVPMLSDELRAAIFKLGIAAATLDKMVALEFSLLADETRREAARQRCRHSLEAWYLEKLTLTEQSKNVVSHGNPAGFFIEALKEDWQSSRLQREQEERKTAQTRLDDRTRLREIERTREQLQAEYNRQQAPIFDELVADSAIFSDAWEATVTQLGSLRNQILKPSMTPLEQYRDSPLIAAPVHIFLKKTWPERFAELAAEFEPRLAAMKKEVEELKRRLP